MKSQRSSDMSLVMTYFMQKFTHRSAFALCAMLAPFAAAAELDVPLTIISSNTPEKVAAIEPVMIDRSGLAVAPVDLQATGGLTSEATLLTVASSKRPMTRDLGAVVVQAASKPLPRGTQLSNTTVSTRTGPLRGTASTLTRQRNVQAGNRQLPAQVRTGARAPRTTLPSAAPSYLLGVFR